MILFIDNYDSFTYNLVQFCGSVNPDIKVVRNDEITVDENQKACSFPHHPFARSRLSKRCRNM